MNLNCCYLQHKATVKSTKKLYIRISNCSPKVSVKNNWSGIKCGSNAHFWTQVIILIKVGLTIFHLRGAVNKACLKSLVLFLPSEVCYHLLR